MLDSEHPFLAKMDYIFQSDMRLFFVMPFINGGELYKVYSKVKRFPETIVKFFGDEL